MFGGTHSAKSLRDPRVRALLGLRATKLGGRIRFRSEDVDKVVRRNLERLPSDVHKAENERMKYYHKERSPRGVPREAAVRAVRSSMEKRYGKG